MSEAIQNIMTRRSVRAYTEQPVEENVLKTILTCGIHAPSGGNHQEIKLNAITDPEKIEKIRMIAWEEFAKMEPKEGQYMNIAINNARTKKDYNFTFRAPVLIVASGPVGWPNGMADSALALQNVMLSAHALGLASCYVNQLRWLNTNERMREYLDGIGLPKDEEIYGTVTLGYTNAPQREAAPRKEGRIRILT